MFGESELLTKFINNCLEESNWLLPCLSVIHRTSEQSILSKWGNSRRRNSKSSKIHHHQERLVQKEQGASSSNKIIRFENLIGYLHRVLVSVEGSVGVDIYSIHDAVVEVSSENDATSCIVEEGLDGSLTHRHVELVDDFDSDFSNFLSKFGIQFVDCDASVFRDFFEIFFFLILLPSVEV